MYNINEILAELQNGVSPETIAEKFTTNLNEAIAQNKAAEEAKRQEELAKRIREDKCADMTDILDRIFNYLDRYFPSHGIGAPDPEDIEYLVDSLDESLPSLLELVTQLKDIETAFKTTPEAKSEKCGNHACKCAKPKSDEETVQAFLKKLGL
jgi:hypothetical protein